jgi:uncharacterized protein with ParB-like and HNH nuclease domain
MAELHVSKKSIGKLFSEMQNRKFIIPDFQRPYKWDYEKCETLWNDIEDFSNTEARNGADYFLGTIVSYSANDKNLEIIDGQQRITSFLLMLRAFYKKLELMPEDADVIGLKSQLAPCIWDIDEISRLVADKKNIHIVSQVATEEDNDTFHKILETGDCLEEADDNYSVNYRFFKGKCDDFAINYPMQWKKLCVTILNKCIVLPIECDAQDTALTIFSTLNDRGLPLADSDIFKAQIYRHQDTDNKKKEFTNTWKELMHICKLAGITVDDIFRYYTHVLRARENDKSKEVGLRRFYADNAYNRLKNESIISELMALANFWLYANNNIKQDEISYEISTETRKYLHCLSWYPNEYWKYPVCVFFLKNKDRSTFDQDLCKLLKGLIANLFAKFIDAPTVNAIKDDVFASCISLNIDNDLQFRFSLEEELLKTKMNNHYSSRISRALMLLDAYLTPEQIDLIPDTFEVEHIFPKKWQDTNYNGWEEKDAQAYLDRFGNKIVFEKKLNIQAGNGYFGKKKEKYSLSKFAVVKKLAEYPKHDWMKEDIELREERFKQNLINFFKSVIN